MVYVTFIIHQEEYYFNFLLESERDTNVNCLNSGADSRESLTGL